MNSLLLFNETIKIQKIEEKHGIGYYVSFTNVLKILKRHPSMKHNLHGRKSTKETWSNLREITSPTFFSGKKSYVGTDFNLFFGSNCSKFYLELQLHF